MRKEPTRLATGAGPLKQAVDQCVREIQSLDPNVSRERILEVRHRGHHTTKLRQSPKGRPRIGDAPDRRLKARRRTPRRPSGRRARPIGGTSFCARGRPSAVLFRNRTRGEGRMDQLATNERHSVPEHAKNVTLYENARQALSAAVKVAEVKE